MTKENGPIGRAIAYINYSEELRERSGSTGGDLNAVRAQAGKMGDVDRPIKRRPKKKGPTLK